MKKFLVLLGIVCALGCVAFAKEVDLSERKNDDAILSRYSVALLQERGEVIVGEYMSILSV